MVIALLASATERTMEYLSTTQFFQMEDGMSVKSQNYAAYLGSSRAVSEARNAVSNSGGAFIRLIRTCCAQPQGFGNTELMRVIDSTMGHANNVDRYYEDLASLVRRGSLDGREMCIEQLNSHVSILQAKARKAIAELEKYGSPPFGEPLYEALIMQAKALEAAALALAAQVLFYLNVKRPAAAS
jgi:hypothetical protein